MKRLFAAYLSFALTVTTLAAGAAPLPDDSIGGVPGGGRFQIGVGHEQIERKTVRGGTADALLDVNLTLGYLAYEITSWMTIVAAGGTLDVQGGVGSGGGDANESYFGLGLHFSLLDLPTDNETFSDARLRIAVRLLYSDFEGDRAGLAMAWQDTRVDLIFGYDLVDIVQGTLGPDKRYHTLLYLGLVNSTIDGTSGGTTSFEEAESFGWTTGLETGWRDRLSFTIHFTGFDELSVGGSLGYRF